MVFVLPLSEPEKRIWHWMALKNGSLFRFSFQIVAAIWPNHCLVVSFISHLFYFHINFCEIHKILIWLLWSIHIKNKLNFRWHSRPITIRVLIILTGKKYYDIILLAASQGIWCTHQTHPYKHEERLTQKAPARESLFSECDWNSPCCTQCCIRDALCVYAFCSLLMMITAPHFQSPFGTRKTLERCECSTN